MSTPNKLVQLLLNRGFRELTAMALFVATCLTFLAGTALNMGSIFDVQATIFKPFWAAAVLFVVSLFFDKVLCDYVNQKKEVKNNE